jgi:hypothetical protein
MAISVVQRNVGGNSNATLNNSSVAFSSSNTAGNAIIVVLAGGDSTDKLMHSDFELPTDTNSNTYKEVFWEFNTQWGMGIKAWIAYGIAAGANTINIVDNFDEDVIFIYEVAGLASSGAFDVAAYAWNTSAGNSFASGSITPNNANSLVLGVVSATHSGAMTYTIGSGYSNLQQQSTTNVVNAACEEKIVSSIASQSASFTGSTSVEGGVTAVLVFSDTSNAGRGQVRDLGSTFTTTSGSKNILARFEAGDSVVVITYHTGNVVTATAPTDDHSGTYTLITSALKASSADIMCVWVRTANFATSDDVVITHNPGTTTGGGLQIFGLRNFTKTGTALIKQSATQANQAAGTPAPALGSTPVSTNPIISAAFWATNAVTNITGRAGYQITNTMHYATPSAAQASMYKELGETSGTITWGGALASAFCSVALELDAPVASSTPTNLFFF